MPRSSDAFLFLCATKNPIAPAMTSAMMSTAIMSSTIVKPAVRILMATRSGRDDRLQLDIAPALLVGPRDRHGHGLAVGDRRRVGHGPGPAVERGAGRAARLVERLG